MLDTVLTAGLLAESQWLQQPDAAQRLTVAAELDSTNRYLLDQPGPWQVAQALHQTAGRGRHGRAWVTEPNGSIALSIGIQWPGYQALQGLSVAISLSLVQALNQHYDLTTPVKTKWPNDLYVDQQGLKKLGGLLVETRPSPQGCWLVVGLGLNIKPLLAPDTACWSSLVFQPCEEVQFIQLSAFLIDELFAALQDYRQHGLDRHAWKQHEILYRQQIVASRPLINQRSTRQLSINQPVAATQLSPCITGQVVDLHDDGGLVVDDDQQVQTIHSDQWTISRL